MRTEDAESADGSQTPRKRRVRLAEPPPLLAAAAAWRSEGSGAAASDGLCLRHEDPESEDEAECADFVEETDRPGAVDIQSLQAAFRSRLPCWVPQQYYVYAPRMPQAEGRYALRPGTVHGLPTWRSGDAVLYSDAYERWKITDSDSVARNVGCLRSGPGPHGGLLPHEAAAWECFTSEPTPTGSWTRDDSVALLPNRKVDNQPGYIYIVGRAVGRHRCRACGAVCVPGKWFRCNVCPEPNDFDLCASCFEFGCHLEHPFTEMDYPSFLPRQFLPPELSRGGTAYRNIRASVRAFAMTPQMPAPRPHSPRRPGAAAAQSAPA
eukprot:TRINITY_DN28548_c1_g1_i2.p1 TRINITY_DN28548_c1_g1~~TRINITY_DN28548_c1_g1_i2.p1  ORF type:complete len:353 (+),score=62.30 TRINITY_DN28548_c1_g1_i2:95-1060(+)